MRRSLLVLSLLLACGDDEAPARDAGPIDAPLEADAGGPLAPGLAFCAAQAEAFCGALSTCACRFDVRPYDAAACAKVKRAACVAEMVTPYMAEVAAGTTRFDPAAIDVCLTRVGEVYAGCRQPVPFDDVLCFAVVQASAAVGQACAGNAVFCGGGAGVCQEGMCVALPTSGECLQNLCAPGLVCHGEAGCGPPVGADQACPLGQDNECSAGLVCGAGATCVPRGVADAACADEADCADGFVCSEARCVPGTPVEAACTGMNQCGSGRGCGRDPASRSCAAPHESGESCMSDTCDDGLFCEEMTCVALPVQGEACLDGFYCADGFTCLDGLGTCGKLAGQGETCTGGSRFCTDGLGCDPDDNTCQPGGGVGEPCLNNPPDVVCGEGLGCDFDTSSCVALRAAGEPCSSDRVCTSGTYCASSLGQCAVFLATGEACTDGNECGPGATCGWQPSGYACAPLPVAGESCESSCAPELTCQGAGGECVAELCTVL